MAHGTDARQPMLLAEVAPGGAMTPGGTRTQKKARINSVISHSPDADDALSFSLEEESEDNLTSMRQTAGVSMGSEFSIAKQCRFCLDTEFETGTGNAQNGTFHPEGMIAPCQCTGSQKWVHRKCLDRWRTINPRNPRTFTHCGICGFQFRLVLANPAPTEDERERRRRRLLFVRRVTVHMLIGFASVQLVLWAVAALILWIDLSVLDEKIVEMFQWIPGEGHNENDEQTFMYSVKHHKSIYYLLSVFVCGTLLGMVGIAYNCARACGTAEEDEQPVMSGVMFDCFAFNGFQDCCVAPGSAGCTCGECCAGCSCEGEAGCACCACALVVLAVVVIFCMLVGFFFAIALALMWCQRSFTTYVQMKEMRQLAEEYVVDDLSRIPTEEAMNPDSVSYGVGPISRSYSASSFNSRTSGGGTPQFFPVSNPMIMSFQSGGGPGGASYSASFGDASRRTSNSIQRGTSNTSVSTNMEVVHERVLWFGEGQTNEERSRSASFMASMSVDNQQEYLRRIAETGGVGSAETGMPPEQVFLPFAPVTSREVSELLQKDLALMFGEPDALQGVGGAQGSRSRVSSFASNSGRHASQMARPSSLSSLWSFGRQQSPPQQQQIPKQVSDVSSCP